MILIPNLATDALTLSAYSYQDREINIVDGYLSQQDFNFERRAIPNDKNDRKGVAFRMLGLQQILRLEDLLGLKFSGEASHTDVNFTQNNGSPYRCIRLKHMPWEKGCADITATDDHAAFIKCSLLANKENWFGADSEAGCCK